MAAWSQPHTEIVSSCIENCQYYEEKPACMIEKGYQIQQKFWRKYLRKYLQMKLIYDKTLGLLWIASEDQFTYHSVSIEAHLQYRNWNFLGKMSSLFDPLGCLWCLCCL